MRYSVPVAVVVMISRGSGRGTELLLQRRANTGFGDGMWDLACSGHVERGETPLASCVRECREELGIAVRAEDIRFFTLVYKRDGQVTYVNPYFHVVDFEGEPKISESDKCSELKWFALDKLPSDLLPDRREAVEAFLEGRKYIEFCAE